MPSKTTTIIIMLFVTGFLSLVNIVISARISHQGAKLQEIALQKQILEKNILETKAAITTSTSLYDVRDHAHAQGFVPFSYIVHLPLPQPVAYQAP